MPTLIMKRQVMDDELDMGSTDRYREPEIPTPTFKHVLTKDYYSLRKRKLKQKENTIRPI